MNTLRYENLSVLARGDKLLLDSTPAASFNIDLLRLKRELFERLRDFVETEAHRSAVTAIALRINESEDKSQENSYGQCASVTLLVTCNKRSETLPDVVIRRDHANCGAASNFGGESRSKRRPPNAEVTYIYHTLEALWLRRELSSSWFNEVARPSLCAV